VRVNYDVFFTKRNAGNLMLEVNNYRGIKLIILLLCYVQKCCF